MLPYIVKIIGVEKYGVIAYITSINAYFLLVVDYGFSLSATKQISENRKNNSIISKIFIEVVSVKILLLITTFIILNFMIVYIESIKNNAHLYIIAFGAVLGQSVFPLWLFQGMEELKKISIIDATSKILSAILIIILVSKEEDYWIIILLNTLGVLTSGFIGIIYAIFEFKIKINFPTIRGVLNQVKKGWHIFLSRIYVSLYTGTNIIILGILTNYQMVGNYAIAEKIVQATGSIFHPITQAFYPYLTNAYKESKNIFYIKFEKLNKIYFYISILLFLIYLNTANEIIYLIGGENNKEIVSLVLILSLTIVTTPLSASFTNGMILIGKEEQFTKIIKKSSIINLIIVFPLVNKFSGAGLAITYVFVQYFTMISLYLALKKIRSEDV
jgi:PST family polysaccharide transporter